MSAQTPDERQDESRESGRGSWEGGYSDSSIQFNLALLEWFEKRIHEPIVVLDKKVDNLGNKLDRHLEWSLSNSNGLRNNITDHVKDDHLRWVGQRRKIEKWAVRSLAAAIPAIIGAIVQLTGRGF